MPQKKSKPSVNELAAELLGLLNHGETVYTPDTVPEGFVSPDKLMEEAGEGASWASLREALRRAANRKEIERVLVKDRALSKPRHWYRKVR